MLLPNHLYFNLSTEREEAAINTSINKQLMNSHLIASVDVEAKNTVTALNSSPPLPHPDNLMLQPGSGDSD